APITRKTFRFKF
ncbi:hypothetical protein D021_2282B, partial [Vibrio parahaemolyticus 10296]